MVLSLLLIMLFAPVPSVGISLQHRNDKEGNQASPKSPDDTSNVQLEQKLKLDSKSLTRSDASIGTESQASSTSETEAESEAEKRKRRKKKGTASLEDIRVKLEALQSIPMEDVFKIAEKASAQAEKQAKGKNTTTLKPIDRVVAFLQQTKKLE